MITDDTPPQYVVCKESYTFLKYIGNLIDIIVHYGYAFFTDEIVSFDKAKPTVR